MLDPPTFGSVGLALGSETHLLRYSIYVARQSNCLVRRQSLQKKLISRDIINGMILAFTTNIRDLQNGVFYFRNSMDGSDKAIGRMEPGRQGNLWFGWNRLAAYDREFRNLFISIAYDLSNGGPNLRPRNVQNKTMTEATLCFYAWAARLIIEQG